VVAVAVSGFLFGIDVDAPGDWRRPALGIVGVGIGLFALLIAGLYA
jgi:hypothetical protein